MFDMLQQRDERAQTFAEPGDGVSFGQKLADVAGELTPSRIGQAVGDLFSEEGKGLTRAALDATMYTKMLSAREQAMAEAAARRIAAVKDATGVQLENPFLGGYSPEARRRVRDSRNDPDFDPRGGIPQAARQIFDEKISGLMAEHPDKVAGLGLDIPIEALGNTIATGAEEGLITAQARYKAAKLSPGGALLSEAVGGAGGGSRDPLSISSWIFGPAGGVGRNAVMRIISEGLTQGAFSLGLTAVEKPAAQAYREERGQPEASRMLTFDEAAHAFGFGFLGGTAIRGGIESAKALFAAGARILRADHAIMEERQPGVTPEAHEAAVDQAIRHSNDPAHEAPPPAAVERLAAAPERAGVPGDVVARAGDPIEVVETMRAARELAEEKGLPPEYAQVTVEQAPNPADHEAVLDRLGQERPQTPAEASLIASDEVEGRAEARAVETERAEAQKRFSMPKAIREKINGYLADFPQGGTKVVQNRIRKDAATRMIEDRELDAATAFERAIAADAERLAGEPPTRKRAAEDFDKYVGSLGPESGYLYQLWNRSKASNMRIRKDALELMTEGGERDIAAAYDRAIQMETDRVAEAKAARKQPVPEKGLYDTNTKHDMMDLVPTQRDDGRSVLIEPEHVEAMGDRQLFLSDLAKNCKT